MRFPRQRRGAEVVAARRNPRRAGLWLVLAVAHPVPHGASAVDAATCRPRPRRYIEKLADYDALFALGGKSLITILYTEGPAVPPGLQGLSDDPRTCAIWAAPIMTPLSVVGDIKVSLRALAPLLATATARDRTEAYAALRLAAERAQQDRRAQLAEGWQPTLMRRAGDHAAGRRRGKRRAPSAPTSPSWTRRSATSLHLRGFLNSRLAAAIFLPARRRAGLGHAGGGRLLARPRTERRWSRLVGDGASLYSPQSLWTAAHEKLPVTFVVMNNREYNILKNFMKSQRIIWRHAATASSRWRSWSRRSTIWRWRSRWACRAAGSSARRTCAGDRGRHRLASAEPDRDRHRGDLNGAGFIPAEHSG